MPRMPRLVMPGYAHHVTQRGVRSLPIFTNDGDRSLYLELMREQAELSGLRFLAWCLMANHVHFVVIPREAESLARGIGEAHRLYTSARNRRENVRGYLFQGRFWSCVLDEAHALMAARYTELNPVRAGVVERPEAYAWSSARYHLGKRKRDPLGADNTVVSAVGDWRGFLREATEEESDELTKHVSTGRPWAVPAVVQRLEKRTGRALTPSRGGWPKGRPRKPGN